jgi:HK97 gp10 family phage protein
MGRVGTRYPRLADSIVIGSVRSDPSVPAVAIYARAFWARFVEFGTRYWPHRGKKRAHHSTRAHPFMRPAVDAETGNTVEIVRESLAKRLTKMGA